MVRDSSFTQVFEPAHAFVRFLTSGSEFGLEFRAGAAFSSSTIIRTYTVGGTAKLSGNFAGFIRCRQRSDKSRYADGKYGGPLKQVSRRHSRPRMHNVRLHRTKACPTRRGLLLNSLSTSDFCLLTFLPTYRPIQYAIFTRNTSSPCAPNIARASFPSANGPGFVLSSCNRVHTA
jgi:hypothetical protein